VKPVMYHYVRPAAPGLPYFPYLSLADFERQLDDFASDYGFVDRDAFIRWADGGPAPAGVLLTFDDGLRDHVEYVLPALQARGQDPGRAQGPPRLGEARVSGGNRMA
jgi:peptidoglycan/xylan/chitin deacetylase (PgdA/CDA1 family)